MCSLLTYRIHHLIVKWAIFGFGCYPSNTTNAFSIHLFGYVLSYTLICCRERSGVTQSQDNHGHNSALYNIFSVMVSTLMLLAWYKILLDCITSMFYQLATMVSCSLLPIHTIHYIRGPNLNAWTRTSSTINKEMGGWFQHICQLTARKKKQNLLPTRIYTVQM